MKNLLKIVPVLLLSFFVCLTAITVSGCAAAMALYGKREVDVAALHIGQHRDEVIMIVGQPYKTQATEEGRKDIFECQRGNAPSTGRAVGHAAMSLLTLGWWEIAGVPIEALSSSKFYLTITYDKEDKVAKIKTSEEKGGLN